MDNQSNTQRNVIPRWRSLELTPTDELSPVKNLRVAVASGGAISRQLDANFSKTKNFEDAAELVESSVSIGNTQRTLSAAKLLQGLQTTPQPLRKLATQLIQESTIIHVAATESVVDLETLQRTSRNRIQVLKTKLHNSPRNGLLAMEIARLQFQLGQHSNAVEYAERAVKTFPNHRYVVRSFACLLSTIGESEKALYYLRKSESFRWDPWVQSAEVAISSSIKKSTKLSKARLQHIRSLRSADKNMTELAAGLATIETESGNRKTAKHLLELSMSSPNENSLAQLRWLQQNKNLAPLVQPNIFVDNASEANVYDSIKLENPTLAVAQAEIWQMDQPFLSQSALIGSSLCLSVLDEPSRALKIVDRALIAQPNDLSLHNNRFVGLVLNGQINEANDLFNERLKTKRLGEYEPFTYAALGLMAFAKGKCDDGRGFYLEAMKSASKNKNPDLVVTAFIYWIGREFSCKQISNSDAVQLIETLEKKLEKQNSVLKRNSMALATIRRRVSAANSSPPLAIASEIKKTADTSYNLLNAAVANETHGDV